MSHLLWSSFHGSKGYSLFPIPFQYGGKEVLEEAIPAVLERDSAARVRDGAGASQEGLRERMQDRKGHEKIKYNHMENSGKAKPDSGVALGLSSLLFEPRGCL